MSDFAPRFGLALIVVIVAIVAIIISRRNYAKSTVVERNIDAFRLEFQRAIDSAQATTIKSVAKTIRDSISSVIRPLDSTMRELDARLERLEQQQADAAASQTAGAQILETTANQIAGTQKQALEENERIAARLIGLEQKLTALTDQLSSIKQTVDGATLNHQENLASLSDQQQNLTALTDQLLTIKKIADGATLREQENVASLNDQQQNLTALSEQLSSIKQGIDEATVREQDIKDSIHAVSSRVLNTQTRLDELFPRLVLGDKARQDQATLIGLFVNRIKKLNANLSDMALRMSALENSFRSKADRLEERHVSILEGLDGPSTGRTEDQLKDAKTSDGAIPIEVKTDGQNGEALQSSLKDKEAPGEASLEIDGGSDNGRADQPRS